MRLASAEITASFVVATLARDGAVWARESSDSMGPLVRTGDGLRLAAVERAGVVPGTLVAYRRDSRLIVHRVLAVGPAGIVTKGDGLESRDAPIAWDAVVARVVAVAGPRGRLTDLTAFPWPMLGRLFAVLSRMAEAVAPPPLPAPPSWWRRPAWRLARLPFHVVARMVR
jgi:hypothetical protein